MGSLAFLLPLQHADLKMVNAEIEKKLQTINKKQDTIEKSVMDRNAKL